MKIAVFMITVLVFSFLLAQVPGKMSLGAEEKKCGQVLSVEPDSVTIDLGTKEYVNFGMEFEVYRRAEILTAPLTDEIILIGERLVGKIKVVKSSDSSSVCKVLNVERTEEIRAGDKVVSVPGTGNVAILKQRELDEKALEILYQGKTAARKSKDTAIKFYRQITDDADLSQSQYSAVAAEEIKRYEAVTKKVAYKSARSFNLTGSARRSSGLKQQAKDVDVDTEGNIWILDDRACLVSKLQQRGDLVLEYGKRGSEEKDLLNPVRIVLDKNNNLYILDVGKPKVVKVDSKGRFVRAYGPKDGRSGSQSGVIDLAVSSKEDIFILDAKTKEVYAYNKDNLLWARFGQEGLADGEFVNPLAIAVDTEDRIYVVDAGKNNIQVFAPDLRFLRKFAPKGISDPVDMAVYHSEAIYVLGQTTGVVTKIDPEKGETIINIGGLGTSHGQFADPSGICVDQEGNIYVADGKNAGIQKFTARGGFVEKLRDEQVDEPCALSVDGRDNIYILDKENCHYQRFDTYGWSQAVVGSSGEGPGQFTGPVEIHTDFDNRVYVLDAKNNKIHKFDSSGKLILAFGDKSTIPEPVDLCVDPDGNIYVLDGKNYTVVKFEGTGKLVHSFGSKRRGRSDKKEGEFKNPIDIAVDSQGNIFVLDDGHCEIYKFSSQMGTLLGTFGTKGRNKGEFSKPVDLAVDGLGYVYVADVTNRTIQKFDTNGVFICEVGSYGDSIGQYKQPISLAVDGVGTVYVLDAGLFRVQQFKQ